MIDVVKMAVINSSPQQFICTALLCNTAQTIAEENGKLSQVSGIFGPCYCISRIQ